jgi:predicted nucleotide-binding protein
VATSDEVHEFLLAEGYTVRDTRDLDQGVQIRTNEGPIVNVYNTGTVQVQGRNKSELEAKLATRPPSSGPTRASRSAPLVDVFVVYGHDEPAKTLCEAMLRRWGCNPILLDQIPAEGFTLIEKLEKYSRQAPFAVVLATADDVYVSPEDEKEFRARQNVVLELGMMLAHLGRPNVAILLEDKVGMRKPSDIDGLEYLPFKKSVKEAGLALAKMMANRGYAIDVQKL